MSSLIDEFDFAMQDEEEVEQTTYEEDSRRFIEEATKFITNAKKNTKITYQGIKSTDFINAISIGKSDIMPWEHVSFTLDVSKLKDVSGNKLDSLTIPSFVEELRSICDKGEIGFGFNQTARNKLRVIEIPSSVVVIAQNTFAMYKKLEEVIFENNCKLMILGNYTFFNCTSLHTLDLRNCEYLSDIPKNVFEQSGIKILKLNSGVQSMYPLENTEISTVYIDDEKYSIEEFNSRLREVQSTNNNSNVFWGRVDFNF
jgi:hypothetical protein